MGKTENKLNSNYFIKKLNAHKNLKIKQSKSSIQTQSTKLKSIEFKKTKNNDKLNF